MRRRKTVDAYGLTMLNETGCYPGGASLSTPSVYDREKLFFDKCLDNVESATPVMIEIGSYWALWSLLFRKRYPSGTNVLVELLEESLSVGIENFKLNGFEDRIISHHGGIAIEESHTFNVIRGRPDMGGEVDLYSILNKNKIKNIDVVHCDIQGSELSFLHAYSDLFESKAIKNAVIGTHPHLSVNKNIHSDVLDFLRTTGYEIIQDHPPRTRPDEDGQVYARAI